MNLLVDIGNSYIKYLLEEEGKLFSIKSLEHQHWQDMFDEYKSAAIEQLIIASVSNQVIAQQLSNYAQQRGINVKQVYAEQGRNGLLNAYPEYKKLGVDRWLALVAAHYHYREQSCLIIDLGTATTIDLLASSGQHLGGWIIAGLDLMQETLVHNTANIGHTDITISSLNFANNTAENVKAGALAATVGAIHIAIAQTTNLISNLDKVILTGGNALKVAHYLSVPTIVDNKLVFKGLQQYLS